MRLLWFVLVHCPTGRIGGIHAFGDGRSRGGCGQNANSCSCQVSVVKRIYVELPSGDLGMFHSTLSSWVIKTRWDRCGFRSYGPVAVFGLLICWFFDFLAFTGPSWTCWSVTLPQHGRCRSPVEVTAERGPSRRSKRISFLEKRPGSWSLMQSLGLDIWIKERIYSSSEVLWDLCRARRQQRKGPKSGPSFRRRGFDPARRGPWTTLNDERHDGQVSLLSMWFRWSQCTCVMCYLCILHNCIRTYSMIYIH